MKSLTRHLSEHLRSSIQTSRERREHDQAIADPRIRDEHYAGRARDVAAGGPDCHFCA